MKIKVGVIFGGETVEHEVSIISAIQAMNKMDEEKYEIVPIYITKEREWYTGDMLKDMEKMSFFTIRMEAMFFKRKADYSREL